MPLSQADQAHANELAKRAAAAFAESDLAQVRTLYGEVLAIERGVAGEDGEDGAAADDGGGDAARPGTPAGLPAGTEFFLLTVRRVMSG